MKRLKCAASIFAVTPLICAVMFVVAGCNTIEGIGKDISGAGQGLADLAADINPENN